MNFTKLGMTIALALMLGGCASTPTGKADGQASVGHVQNGLGSVRLPADGPSYLDSKWFEQTLSADLAVQAAMLNNPSVRLELSRLDAAQAERIQAGLLQNPMTNLMAMRPEGGGRYELGYSFMQSLFDLFTRSQRVAIADAAQRQVEADVIMKLLTLSQNTEAAFYDALADQQRLDLRREEWDLERKDLKLIESQVKQGVLPTVAALEQQAITSMKAHQMQAAEAALTQSRSALAQQLGLSSATGLRLPGAFPAFTMEGFDAPELQALASRRRPELQAAAAGIEQAEAERILETGSLRTYQPSLGLVGVRERSGMQMNGLDLQILLPIFDSGQARDALTSAKLAQARYSAESMQRLVPLEVESALATLLAAQDAAAHATHHLQQQVLLEQLSGRNYQQGTTDLFSYHRSSRARLAAVADQIDARQDLWAAAVALQRSTGAAVIGQSGEGGN